MKFRKKPVVIEAIQWTGNNHAEINDFCAGKSRWGMSPFEGGRSERETLVIVTLEGQHIATVGDFIIRGVKGEFYPCKPDIFAATYEPVEGKGDGGQ
jgi:hypothetical protein